MRKITVVAAFGLLVCTQARAGIAPPAPVSTTALSAVKAAFVQDAGQLGLYLFQDGTAATALTDSSPTTGGANPVPINVSAVPAAWATTIGLPAWTADGGLSFTASTGYLTLPSAVQGVQWAEFMIGNAITTRTNSSSLASPSTVGISGYGGTYPAPGMTLSNNYGGRYFTNGGWASTFPAPLVQSSATVWNSASSSCSIDNGVHRITFLRNTTTGLLGTYVDGAPCPLLLYPTALGTGQSGVESGGNWQIGGSLAVGSTYATGGFKGTIYGAMYSTTYPTAAQIAQNDKAWRRLADLKGINLSPYYANVYATPYIHTDSESWGWAHAATTPLTQNFTAVATATLTTQLGTTWTADTIGGSDSASSYTMATQCMSDATNSAQLQTSGPNVFILHDNGNASRNYNPWPTETVTGGATYLTAIKDLQALGQCARAAHANGYNIVLLGLVHPSGSTGTYADAKVKDVLNPIRRALAVQYGFNDIIDDNDARFAADGSASVSGTAATNCMLSGGSAGPTWNSGDLIHLVACGYSIYGQQVAAVIEWNANLQAPPLPDTISAVTGTMPFKDLNNVINLTGASPAMTLQPTGGLHAQARLVTINNTGSGAATITGGTEYNAGAQDLINGAATYSLAPGASVDFLVTRGTDAVSGSGLVTHTISLARTTSSGITAAGTTLATATALTAQDNFVTTAASGTGVALPNYPAGQPVTVRNAGANTLNIYPFSATDQIEATTAGTAATLASGSTAVFERDVALHWYRVQ